MPQLSSSEMSALLGLETRAPGASTVNNAITATQVKSITETVPVDKPVFIDTPKPSIITDTSESEEEIKRILAGEHTKDYQPMEFEDAHELLKVFHPAVRTGDIQLYDHQIDNLKFVCHPTAFTRENPLQFILCASNGSGKDAFFIAPFAIWHAVTKIRSRCIITSASHNQLKNQTEPGIRVIAQEINKFFGESVLVIKQFHIISKITGSEILMFVTDESGLAEGFHPYSDIKNAEMALVMNEAKTIPEIIFEGLRRCNGFNRWLEVSSPGKMSGHMYNHWKRATTYPLKYKLGKTNWYGRKITSYDCAHIAKSIIEDDRISYGESSPLFRSMHMADFTDLSENPVIPGELIERMIDADVEHIKGKMGSCAGVDLAFGGEDATVGYCIDGNKILDRFEIKGLTDTIEIEKRVRMYLNTWKSQYVLKDENVKVDHGNAGRSIIDMLRRNGWAGVIAVLNQSSAFNPKAYANRGTEMYFILKRLIEEKVFSLPSKYSQLIDQLRSRRYRESRHIRGALVIEPKKEARANGRPSPNDADALVLAISSYSVEDYVTAVVNSKPKEVEATRYTLGEVARLVEDGEKLYDTRKRPIIFGGLIKRHFGSLSSVMNNKQQNTNKVYGHK